MRACLCVCASVCVCACVCAHVRVRLRVRVRVHVRVRVLARATERGPERSFWDMTVSVQTVLTCHVFAQHRIMQETHRKSEEVMHQGVCQVVQAACGPE